MNARSFRSPDGVGGDQTWVWKAFLWGHNVLFMDPTWTR